MVLSHFIGGETVVSRENHIQSYTGKPDHINCEKSFNSDGQEIHQYQQQPQPQIPRHEKTTTYELEVQVLTSDRYKMLLGYTGKCCLVIPVKCCLVIPVNVAWIYR
jgi:hypothetical protein